MRWVLLLLAVLAACNTDPGPPPRPALWEVTGPGGARGYVFGTVHALPARIAWQSDTLAAALGRSDRLVLEIAGEASQPAARRTFLALGTTPGLPPLEDRVAAEWRDEARAALTDARLDPAQFRALEDWAAALTLANALDARDGADSAHGSERVLLKQAARRPVIALETVAGQLGVFDALPGPAQRALLEAVVAESADPDRGQRLIDAWARGDVAALDREAHAGMLAHPRLRSALLVERNRAWANQVAAMLRAGQRPFVAVGAAHVVGAEGLPALLAHDGFEVRRVQ